MGRRVIAVFILSWMLSCKGDNKQNRIASYIGNPQNGLTKKMIVDSSEIFCQLIPDENEKKEIYKFNIYINTKLNKMTDSVLYKFNYQSVQLFSLVSNKDTLRPVLSERIANGRRDINQFTVVFNTGEKPLQDTNIVLMIGKNELMEKAALFTFSNKTLIKALKQLYGHEQNNN